MVGGCSCRITIFREYVRQVLSLCVFARAVERQEAAHAFDVKLFFCISGEKRKNVYVPVWHLCHHR